jgi:hypothetical protein
MDAATKMGDPVGVKYSSGTMPPELFSVESEGEGKKSHNRVRLKVHTLKDKDRKENGEQESVQSCQEEKKEKQVPAAEDEEKQEVVRATAAVDCWALGVVLYKLCTDTNLFMIDGEDDLVVLAQSQ